jgi:hypothetical protein
MASRHRDPRVPRAGADARGRPGRSECDVDRLVADVERPGLALRARVYKSRRALDAQLAKGVSPARSAALALRARQLVSSESRQRLARRVVRRVEEAQRARPIALPRARRAIHELQMALLDVAVRLRTERPVYAQGMASLSLALGDTCRSAYSPRAANGLCETIRAATEALDGHPPRRRPRA